MDKIRDAFSHLCETIAALRHPVTGCPWDLEQTHGSLRRYMIEEAYEAVDVMEPTNFAKLREELGDVLLQVVLNAQLAQDAKQFSILDVVRDLDQKMRRRHPHVFGENSDPQSKTSRDKSDIRAKWEEIKTDEKRSESTQTTDGVFSSLQSGKMTPASRLTVAIGKVAKSIAFDWSGPDEVFTQLESEVKELKQEVTQPSSKQNLAAELGDVYFCLGQLCRHLDIDPEVCAIDGNRKFLKRFEILEKLAKSEGIDVRTAGTSQLETLWGQAKAVEKSQQSKIEPKKI